MERKEGSNDEEVKKKGDSPPATIMSYCTNTIQSFEFVGDEAMEKMRVIVKMFRIGFRTIGGLSVENVMDYSRGIEGLPKSEMVEYRLAGGSALVLKPSANEPKLNVYVSIKSDSEESAAAIEKRVCDDLESIIYMDDRMGYCCE